MTKFPRRIERISGDLCYNSARVSRFCLADVRGKVGQYIGEATLTVTKYPAYASRDVNLRHSKAILASRQVYRIALFCMIILRLKCWPASPKGTLQKHADARRGSCETA